MRVVAMVLISANPIAPPRLRIRLYRPDAFLTWAGGRRPSAIWLTGSMMNIIENPRSACGPNNSQNEDCDVKCPIQASEEPKAINPKHSILRRSSRRDSAPTIGAEHSMTAPVTNMV